MPERVPTPLASALVVLALAGCAAPPLVERTPVDAAALPHLAPAASATALAPSIERWWVLFGDVELDRLVEQALVHNHDLAVAAARLREARARLDETSGARLPSLTLQAQAARARQSGDASLPPGLERIGSRHTADLVGRYEVDLWGRLAAANDAASQRLRAQAWARAAVEWGLAAQVAESHFTRRAVQQQIEISEAVRAGRAATVIARQREFAAGSASEFDLRRAEAELAGTDTTLAGLQRQRVALESTLALLTGRPLAAVGDSDPEAQPLDLSRRFVAALPQGDAANLLLARPDVRQAEAELAAAQADVAAARAATLPALSLSGSAGSDVRKLSDLFNAPGFVWSLALSASAPLFDGGQLAARVTQADARAEGAQASYRKVVLNAVLELREAYATLDITQRAEHAGRERVAALERARRIAQTGYSRGALTYLDLLDAERNAFQAQLDEVGAYRDRLIGQVGAFKALGGGYARTTLE